jgi:heat-inducible transcriptional repressor
MKNRGPTLNLPERQRLILKEIVDRYIRRHEPVSSRMILEDYGLAVSSATVRNDMNDLEKHGFIAKPYSSSGRVPTKRGYRFFVDWLLDLSELQKRDRFEVVETSDVRILDVSEAMRQTAFLLGNITGYAGFVVPPHVEHARLERVLLTRMADRHVFLVVVSDIGVIEQGLIPLDVVVTEEETDRMMETINRNLRGASLEELRRMAAEETPDGAYERPERQALIVIAKLLGQRMGKRVIVDGLLQLIDRLEELSLEDAAGRFARLGRAVQDEAGFPEALAQVRNHRQGVVVNIGDFPLPGFEEFSVISSDYRPHGGVLGVIAPTCMDYGRAMSASMYVANRLEALLTAARCRETKRMIR